MARLDLPVTGILGQGRSINSNPAAIKNAYIELNAVGEPRLVRRSGSVLKFTLPNSPVRGCYSDTDTSYWVAGNGVYKRTADNVIKLLGTIGTTNGFVNFASSGQVLALVDGDKGYGIQLATDAFAVTTDPGFPPNPVDISYISGFWVVTAKNSQQFYFKLVSAPTWNGLDFATAEGNPDNILSQKILNDELYLIGYKTVEVWDVTGNGASPFQRNRAVVIDHGCIAANSVGKAMDTLYWLGGDNLGQGIVWRLNGYQVERVSTHEIEQKIAVMDYIINAFAVVYQQDGHVFYVLQFPSAGKTLVYDIINGVWAEWSYKDDFTGVENIWKASCHCFSAGNNLVGDTESGKVFALDKEVFTDDGNEIVTELITMVDKLGQSFLFFNELIIDIETGMGNNLAPGDDPKIGVCWSDDAGHSWSNWRFTSIGKIGRYGTVVRYDMLGSARNRVWWFRVTDPVKVVVMGIVVNADRGIT
jgi:Phage stabilisation protein